MAVFDEEIHCAKSISMIWKKILSDCCWKEENLSVISLDAKYECMIGTKTELLSCSGTVKERFQCEAGEYVDL